MNCLECGLEGDGISPKKPYHEGCFQLAFVKALHSMSQQLAKEKEMKQNGETK